MKEKFLTKLPVFSTVIGNRGSSGLVCSDWNGCGCAEGDGRDIPLCI